MLYTFNGKQLSFVIIVSAVIGSVTTQIIHEERSSNSRAKIMRKVKKSTKTKNKKVKKTDTIRQFKNDDTVDFVKYREYRKPTK